MIDLKFHEKIKMRAKGVISEDVPRGMALRISQRFEFLLGFRPEGTVTRVDEVKHTLNFVHI
jgi:hypothetical protein